MAPLLILLKFLPLGFSALLPLINPVGSALVLLGMVGPQPVGVYRALAAKIARNTVLLLIAVDLVGTLVLRFFGLSLPVVQLAGGGVVAAIGWKLLNRAEDASEDARAASTVPMVAGATFYPLTFPVTAGPGCIVVMLTLSAHASQRAWGDTLMAHLGLWLGILSVGALVYFAYASAPRLANRISPQTTQGIVRIIAFILLCIGVQIAWNGVENLVRPLLHR